MRVGPVSKKRERLAIESFVRDTKVKGKPLTFTADDVSKHHSNMRLPRRALAKALQNMIYAKAGIVRSKDGAGVCVVNSDTLPWMQENVAAETIVAAPTSNVRRRRRKGSRVAARVKVPAARSPSGDVLVAEVVRRVEHAIREKTDELQKLIGRLFAVLDE